MPNREPDALEPPIHPRPLPQDVARARSEWDAASKALEQPLQTTFGNAVVSCRSALEFLASVHRRIIECTDIDLDARTRWVAIWETSGHAIALGNAAVDQVELGHTSQVYATTRALGESLALTLAMCAGDEALVRLWLRGRYVSPKRAGLARTAFYVRSLDGLNRQGTPLELNATYRELRASLEADGIDTSQGVALVLDTINDKVGGQLASAAHNSRAAVGANVSRQLRSFSYGRHPDPRARLRTAVEVTSLVQTTVLDVGFALSEIVNYDALRASVVRHQEALSRAMDQADMVIARVN